MTVRQGSREATLPIFIKLKSSFCLKQEEAHNKRVRVGDWCVQVCTGYCDICPSILRNFSEKKCFGIRCNSFFFDIITKKVTLYADDSWVSLDSCDKSSKSHSKISSLLLRTAHIQRRKRTIQDDYLPRQKFRKCCRAICLHVFFTPAQMLEVKCALQKLPASFIPAHEYKPYFFSFFFFSKEGCINFLFRAIQVEKLTGGFWALVSIREPSERDLTSACWKGSQSKKKSASLCLLSFSWSVPWLWQDEYSLGGVGDSQSQF